MPRGKATAAKAKKTAPKTSHPLANPLPEGTVLHDVAKGEWRLGGHVGKGGFGLIYGARRTMEKRDDFVVKIEPLSNGPLFCEIHFYKRVAKQESIEKWIKDRRLRHLGIPRFVAFGHHKHGDQECRFLVMQRFGEDLQRIWERLDKRFPPITVFTIGLSVLDALEFMHDAGYAHADIKAANLLRGGDSNSNEIFLVDFGLAFRFRSDGQCQPEVEDPKRRHDGTLEFCSRDAHRGLQPAPRGDVETLGLCMLQWAGGRLPWEKAASGGEKEAVAAMKVKSMQQVGRLATESGAGDLPELVSFLEAVKRLDYTDIPDYQQLRKILLTGVNRVGEKEPRLVFDATTEPEPAKKTRGRKRPVDADPHSNSAKRLNGAEAKIPSTGRGAKSPASTGRGAKSPASTGRGAKSPASTGRGAKSPASTGRGAKSPASTGRGAQDIIPGVGGRRADKRMSASTQTSPHMLAQLKQERRRRKVVADGDGI